MAPRVSESLFKMQHLAVAPTTPLESNPVLRDISSTFSSEILHNQWNSIGTSFHSNLESLQISQIVSFVSALSFLPVVIYSDFNTRPRLQTFAIDFGKSAVSLLLNASFEIKYSLDENCGLENCAVLKRKVKNALKDPISIFLDTSLDGTVFASENSMYVSGLSGGVLRILMQWVDNPIEVIIPDKKNWPQQWLNPRATKNMQPHHLKNFTIGTSR